MEPKEFLFELGEMVKDTITGLEGVVIGKTKWISGCVRYGLQPKGLKDGIPLDEQWFDEQRLEQIEAAVAPAARKPGPGGPQNDPSPPPTPPRR